MSLPGTDCRIFWPSTAASIPANFTRDTNFDDRYCQGDDEPHTIANGGAASHGHTVAGTHTPIGNAHTHTFTGDDYTAAAWPADDSPAEMTIGRGPHGHISETSASATITYTAQSITINNSTDQHPPFARMIIISPDDANQDIPDAAVVFGDNAALPTGFSKATGADTSPDLDGLFLRGAAAAGDGGGTGGAATHAPTSPVHSHGQTNHPHAATPCGGLTIDTVTVDIDDVTRGARDVLLGSHHSIAITTASAGTVGTVAVTVEAASNSPAYIKLLGLENTSGSPTTPDGVIIGYAGSTAPAGWLLCDGNNGTQDCTDLQILCTTTDGEIGDTGGSNSHSHNLTDHNHTHTSSHNHSNAVTSSVIGIDETETGASDSVLRGDLADHGSSHAWDVFPTTPTMQTTTGLVTSSDDGRQPYRTLLWIKKVTPTSKNFSAGTMMHTPAVLAG